jgi:putative transposase
MRPTQAQAHALNRMAGARRYVWNWGLKRRQDHYKATGKTLPLKTLMAELTRLKRQPGLEWLAEADSQALQQVLKDLYRAYDNHFNPKMKARLPKFKSRKRDRARFRIPQRVKLADGTVVIPKIGDVRIRQSQPVEETTKSATFRRAADGKWYVSLTVEFEMPDVALPPPDPAKVVGIDLGLIGFATLSDGSEPIPAPKFYRKAQVKFRKAQRTLSRRQEGSKRKAKAKVKVARIHQRTANQRGDFLHKLTTDLVSKHDGLCIEDLCVQGLARTKLSKSFTDAAMGEFRRQLTYKAEWNREHLVVIDRFFPSSKMCNSCGALNDTLTLSDREWDCDCGAHHKRDFLAACNLRDEGLRILAEGYSESLNAQGAGVRLATREQPVSN